MIIIAHRGLLQGPHQTQWENHPQQALSLLEQDYQVELDVRYLEHKWYLGHDQPQHEVDVQFLTKPGLWLHAKNTAACDALQELRREYHFVNFFWHESDSRTLTSQGHWWTQPGHDLVQNSVAVLPELHVTDLKVCLNWCCLAICTDWGSKFK